MPAEGPVAFLEAVALFLRMIPLYPPGHVRVAAATERLLHVLHEAPGATVVEVTRGGLRVRGEDAGNLGPGPAAFRAALLQTAVSRVTFEPGARPDAYVGFSRALQRNTRLAGRGRVTFSDLWNVQIPGIRVEELRFRREGFESADAPEPGDVDALSYAEALEVGDALFSPAGDLGPDVEGASGGSSRGSSGARGDGQGADAEADGGTGGGGRGTGGGHGSGTGSGSGSSTGGGGGTGVGTASGGGVGSGTGSGSGIGSDSGIGRGGGSGSRIASGPADVEVVGRTGTGSGTGTGTGEHGAGAEGLGTGGGVGGTIPQRSRVVSASPDLRALLQSDEEIRKLLVRAEHALGEAPSTKLGSLPAGSDADFLEHLVRLLPIEARSDPAKGREAVRRVLERFLEGLAQDRAARDHRPQAALLMQALWGIFPRRRDLPREVVPPNILPPPPAKQDPDDGDLRFLDALGPAPDEPSRVVSLASARTPALTPDHGILDPSGILTHAWLVEPVKERRDALRVRLLDVLSSRSATLPPPCILSHMRAMAAVPAPATDLEGLARLAEVAELTGLDRSPALRGWLPEDVVVAAFPGLLRAYLRAGGAAQPVLRRVGRARLLGIGDALFDRAVGLDTRLVDEVLASEEVESWWVIEALLAGKDAALHARAQRVLRARELPSIAAVALRAMPSTSVPIAFLRILAEDGTEGADSHRLDDEALVMLRHCAEDGALPSSTRVYATACLSAFPKAAAEPILRSLLRRRFAVLPVLPRAVRRQARVMLRSTGAAPLPAVPAHIPIHEEGS